MTEEPTLSGFVARLQAKEDRGELTYRERKYREAMNRRAKQK